MIFRRIAAAVLSTALCAGMMTAVYAEGAAADTDTDTAVNIDSIPLDQRTYMGITADTWDAEAEPQNEGSTLFNLFGTTAYADDEAYTRTAENVQTEGIDVSWYQSYPGGNSKKYYPIDWKAVAADGIDFAFIKAAGRGYGDAGTLYKDPCFKTNIEGAKAAGLKVGVYFFSQAVSLEEAVEEADMVCDMVDGYDLDLPIFIDYEFASYYRVNNGASNAERTEIIKAFCEEVINRGYQAGVYTYASLAGGTIDGKGLAEDYWFWVASYGLDKVSAYYKGAYDYWQYADNGSVSGIQGGVDMDHRYEGTETPSRSQNSKAVYNMYRLYNPNTGEHFFTADSSERDKLKKLGWRYEGIAWLSVTDQSVPVYRLYNSNGSEHHYTTSESERDKLIAAGWRDEGIGWYSDPDETTSIYRVYNPNAFSNNHHYTSSKAERDRLVAAGWRDEGLGWYGY